MSGSARAMEAHYERFIGTVRARQNEIEKACMGILQRSFELDRLRKETSDQWRLDRRVRRFSRREMARDCRQRDRQDREMKRRRKTIADWWQMTVSLRPQRQGKIIPTRLKGFPDSDGWVQVIDEPTKEAP